MQGFHPQKNKAAQVKNYANGGIVQGPGTGTSDDVPAMVPEDGYILPADSVQAMGFNPGMKAPAQPAPELGFKPGAKRAQLSNGEAVLTPEQVQAAGGFEALEAMKNATHTPVPDQNMVEQPKFFFANGGPLDEEARKPFMPTMDPALQRDMSKMYSAGMTPRPQPAAPVAPPPVAGAGRGFVGDMAAQIRNPAPGAGITGRASVPASAYTSQAPVQQRAQPAQPPINATGIEGWRTKAVMDGAAEDAQSAWDRGQVGQAAGAVARGAITAVPTAIGEFGYNTVAPVAGAAMGFWKGLTGAADAAPSPKAAQALPVQKVTAPTAAVPTGSAIKPASPPAATPVGATGMPEKPGTPAAQANMQAAVSQPQSPAPGIYQHGRGQFSDNPEGMGFKPGFTGQPNAQNNAAAEQLAQRSAGLGFRPQSVQPAEQPQGSQPQVSGSGFGILDAGYRAQRAALMDVQQGKPGAKDALNALLKQQTDAPGLQIERDRLAQQGEESRADRGFRSQELQAKLGESAADRALRGQEVADNGLTNAVKRDAAGLEVSAAKQMAALRDQYLNAKTPQEQAAAAAKIQGLTGKVQADEYIAIDGGETVVDPSTGLVIKNPQQMVSRQTGQPVQGQQAAQQAQGTAVPPPEKRTVGATSTVNGKTAVWNGTKWVPQ